MPEVKNGGAILPCRMPLRLPRNPIFYGRARELEELDKHLLLSSLSTADGGQGFHRYAVSGMGGVGKTELVVEWAYRRMLNFQAVFWVDAGDAAQLAASYAKILPALTLRPLETGAWEDSGMEARREATKRWFARAKEPWLLIFDNADSIELLSAYWPTTGALGSVVVTSRDPASKSGLDAWGGFGTPGLHLEPFPETEAADFIQKLTGCADTPNERQACLDMSRQLGCLPLAIMGMSHAIHRRQWSVRRTVASCEKDGGSRPLWATLSPEAPAISRYGKAMAAAWGLGGLDANALELLQLLSMLGPGRIQKRLFVTTPEEEARFGDSIATLSSSLIKWDRVGEELTMHRVIAEEVRARMSDETLHRNFRKAVRLIHQGWQADRFETRHVTSLWPEYESTVFPNIEHVHKMYKVHKMEWAKGSHDVADSELIGLFQEGAA